MKPAPREPRQACEKRAYSSPRKARRANAKAGFRLRVYRCDECQAYHVANADKGAT